MVYFIYSQRKEGNKLKKSNLPIFIIFGFIFLLVIFNQNLFQKKEGLSVHYYQNNVEVFPNKGFSIINSVTYNQISFSVYGTATNTPYSNIQIVDANPIQLKNALPATTQSLSSGETRSLWNSSLINTSQFEGLTQPIRFSVNISGKNDYTGLTEYKNNFIDLTISPSTTYIYQETANEISCGSSGTWETGGCLRSYDGSWTSYGQYASTYFPVYLYLNYTLLGTTRNSLTWKVKDYNAGNGAGVYLNIENCSSYLNKLPLRAVSTYLYCGDSSLINQVGGSCPNHAAQWQCLDSSNNWLTLRTYLGSSRVYEEGISYYYS